MYETEQGESGCVWMFEFNTYSIASDTKIHVYSLEYGYSSFFESIGATVIGSEASFTFLFYKVCRSAWVLRRPED